MIFTLVALFLQVVYLQPTKSGFIVLVAKHSEASFIWTKIKLLVSGKKDLKFSGNLHQNLSAKHRVIALETLSVPLLIRIQTFTVFAIRDTIGTLIYQTV